VAQEPTQEPNPRPNPRKVVGSRSAAPRPRKLAGTGRPEEPTQALQPTPVEPTAPTDPTEPIEDRPQEPTPAAESRPSFTASRDSGAFLGSLRTTAGLVAAVVVLALVSAAEIGWLTTRDDPVVSSSRPVVTGEVTHRAATDAAQRDVVEIFTYGYQDFDARIAKATSLMTPAFAQQFRTTADDVKSDFIANKTEQLVKVRGTSVVRASDSQVQALIFLDQYVTKKGGAGKGGAPSGTDYTPFRALVTMVHTDHGWLVDNIDTT
jgi:Mce-associated membrane protein